MKRNIVKMVLICFCLAILSGCTAGELQKKGAAFAEAVFSGDYDAAIAQMTENMLASMPAEALSDLATSVEEQFGAFDSVASVTVGSDPNYPDHTLAKVKVKLATSFIILELAYDKDLKLDGLNVLASEEMNSSEPIVEDGTENARNDGVSQTDTDDTNGTDSTDKGALALQFLDKAFSGDIDGAVACLAQSAQTQDSADSLSTLVAEAEANYGAYEEIGAVKDSGDTAIVNVILANGSVLFEITFDDSGKISGFSLYAQ